MVRKALPICPRCGVDLHLTNPGRLWCYVCGFSAIPKARGLKTVINWQRTKPLPENRNERKHIDCAKLLVFRRGILLGTVAEYVASIGGVPA